MHAGINVDLGRLLNNKQTNEQTGEQAGAWDLPTETGLHGCVIWDGGLPSLSLGFLIGRM